MAHGTYEGDILGNPRDKHLLHDCHASERLQVGFRYLVPEQKRQLRQGNLGFRLATQQLNLIFAENGNWNRTCHSHRFNALYCSQTWLFAAVENQRVCAEPLSIGHLRHLCDYFLRLAEE